MNAKGCLHWLRMTEMATSDVLHSMSKCNHLFTGCNVNPSSFFFNQLKALSALFPNGNFLVSIKGQILLENLFIHFAYVNIPSILFNDWVFRWWYLL